VAKVSFETKSIGSVSSVSSKSFSTAVFDKDLNVSFKDKSPKTSYVSESNKRYARFNYESVRTVAQTVLPFRVRFINIGVVGYSPDSPAPIGIAVIGLNNYIL
jgi:PKD repeat protein